MGMFGGIVSTNPFTHCSLVLCVLSILSLSISSLWRLPFVYRLFLLFYFL